MGSHVDQSFLNQLRNLELVARKRVSTLNVGSKRSTRTGKGMELSDHRQYYPGDDIKAIDWTLYSRTERLYIRRFEEEKDLSIHILLDTSNSMNFSSRGMRKFDYAANLAAGFAYVSMSNYEKFGTALFTNHVQEIVEPKKGKTHFFQLVELIDTSTQEGKTDLKKAIEEYTKTIKTPSFVIIISDFLEPEESLKDAVYRIAKYSKEAILIQVLDPGEIRLPWQDDVDFLDMEVPAQEKTYLSPNFKENYEKKIKNHIYKIREVCKEAGVDFYSFTTDRRLFDSFIEVVEGRRQRGIF